MSALIKSKESIPRGRRRVPRRPIDINIGVLAKGTYYVTKGIEIGEGGMLIECPQRLEKGQLAVVTIRLPGVLQGAMLCQVVYILESLDKSSPNRYGVQFENIEFDVKRKIRNFVASSSGSYIVRTSTEEKEFLEEEN